MNIPSTTFRIAGSKIDCLQLQVSGCLKSAEAEAIRKELNLCKEQAYDAIYMDVKNVTDTDLSGINEIINSHYTLMQLNKQLILVYKQASAVDKWLQTTGMSHIIETAVLL
jgi:anti-anti-sigma regulatory factor